MGWVMGIVHTSLSGGQHQHTNRVTVVCFVLCVIGLMRMVLAHSVYSYYYHVTNTYVYTVTTTM